MSAIIQLCLQLAVMFFGWIIEKDKQKKAEKKEMLNEGTEALKSRDISRVNASIERMRS